MYFTIRKNLQGKFWWRAVGDNNEVMASSELMTTKQACKDAIRTVQGEAKSGRVIDHTDKVSKR